MNTKNIIPINASVDALKRQLESQSIIWIGTGTSIPAGYPSAAKLVAELKLAADDPITEEDFPLVADEFVKSRGPGALRMILQKLIGQPALTTQFHKAIATLGKAGFINNIITTNYDNLMERALGEDQVNHIVKTLDKNFDAVPPGTVNVMKIHGSLEDWESIVLSSNSYSKFEKKYILLNKLLDVLCTQYPITFIGSSLCEPRILNWLSKRSEKDRLKMHPWRAILTNEEFSRLLEYEWRGIKAKDVLQGLFRPLIIDGHSEINALWTQLSKQLVPEKILEVKTEFVPGLEIDGWPSRSLQGTEISIFVKEAAYRADHNSTPYFNFNLATLRNAQQLVMSIEKKNNVTTEERNLRIDNLQVSEYYTEIRKKLEYAITVIVSDSLRRELGWGFIPTGDLFHVVVSLLGIQDTEGKIKVLLINNSSRIYTSIYLERSAVEKLFDCSVDPNTDFLSVLDTNYASFDLSYADYNLRYFAFGLILKKCIENRINEADFKSVCHFKNWVLSGD